MAWQLFSKKQKINTAAKQELKKDKETTLETEKENKPQQIEDSSISSTKQMKKKPSIIERGWEIVKFPYLSEKAIHLKEINQYIFTVHQKANKNQIKKAIESLYNVKVTKVNIVRNPAKIRKYRNLKFAVRKEKKAIVTLAQGQKIEI